MADVKSIVVGEYDFVDEDGELKYWKVRLEPSLDGKRKKQFIFYHYDEDGTKQKGRGEGQESLLYNLPELKDAKQICMVEGEAKADRLKEFSYTATSLDAGAGSKVTPEMVKQLSGKQIVFFPDQDKAGRAFAERVGKALHGHVEWFCLVTPDDLKEGEDMVDWLKYANPQERQRCLDVHIDKAAGWEPPEELPVPAPAPEPTPAPPPPVEETLIPLEQDLTNEEIKELTEMEISPDEVFLKTCTFIEERVGLPAGGKELLALWAMNSYTQMVFDVFPYILVESVTHGLGKTTVMEILNSIVYKGEIMVAPTPASIYEGIDCGDFLTAFIDEFDQVSKESKQDVLGIFNAGYKKGGTVSRQRGNSGTSAKRKKFKVGCQKMFASIGGLRNTLLDRCIVIHMQRVYGTWKSTFIRPLKRDSAPIRKLLRAYALQEGLKLKELYDDQPDETYFPQFKNREAELFSTLLMHTKLMSPEEAGRVLKIALGYSTSKHQLMEQKSDSLTLIRELHDALTGYPFNVEGKETFRPTDLIDHLVGYSDGWAKKLKGDKDNKAKDGSSIRDFLKDFDLPKAERKRDGSHHKIEVVVQALAQALPQELQQVQQPSQPTDNSKDNGVAVTPNTATETPTSATGTATVQPVDNKRVNGDVAVVAVKGREGKSMDEERVEAGLDALDLLGEQEGGSGKISEEMELLERQRRIDNGEE